MGFFLPSIHRSFHSYTHLSNHPSYTIIHSSYTHHSFIHPTIHPYSHPHSHPYSQTLICPFIYPCIYPSVHKCIHPSAHPAHTSIHLCVHTYMNSSIGHPRKQQSDRNYAERQQTKTGGKEKLVQKIKKKTPCTSSINNQRVRTVTAETTTGESVSRTDWKMKRGRQ